MVRYSLDALRSLIGGMDLARKVGQLFMLAFPGKDTSAIEPLLRRYGLGGCYLSQDNAETFEEAHRLSHSLQHLSSVYLNPPLLLGVDQEGAWGVLVPASHTGPGNLALGRAANRGRVLQMYRLYGQEMASVGFNTLLGPCADVNSQGESPIIDVRAFGEDPGVVAACVAAAVEGARSGGVVTALKHFPGHGGTKGDSHRELPVVDKDEHALLAEDLLPFQVGIREGAEMVMTSHIRYPAIDPDHPATLSPRILQHLLRERLGFQGVILSDSMNMSAIRKHYTPAESTLLALRAGVDMIMLSEEHYSHDQHYLAKQVASMEAVEQAVKNGQFDEGELEQKLLRILHLKLNLLPAAPSLPLMSAAEASQLEFDSAREGVALLQKGLWPLPSGGKLVCVNATPRNGYANLMNSRGIGPNQEVPAFSVFSSTLEQLGEKWHLLTQEELENSEALLGQADAIVVVTEDYPLPGEDFAKAQQQECARALAARYPEKTIVVGLRSPYELHLYPREVSYLCACSSRPCSAAEAARILCSRDDLPVASTTTEKVEPEWAQSL